MRWTGRGESSETLKEETSEACVRLLYLQREIYSMLTVWGFAQTGSQKQDVFGGTDRPPMESGILLSIALLCISSFRQMHLILVHLELKGILSCNAF